MSWDRGAPSQVVETPRSARLNADTGPKWQCDECGALNGSTISHCRGCGVLRKEEREMRMHARSERGLGKGGGYFERGETSSRKDAKEDAKGGLDIYGRVIGSGKDKAKDEKPKEKKEDTSSKSTKADRQKAALERLRGRKQLSPPRPTHFREKSSRSRSAERRRESKRVFNY
eukprot:TRINITY_DN95631_c0_g1_i1.p1 TRINITY_DN95631_c0_g1~~TRINITY_DN95631_c0_g1_i1.p1  ORF type:complete len:173 (+),score=32.94 TRINITY_DN95631_c0_g1_i1:23-541(+)